jgi:thiamine pyrophosphate-dependent acetolactate synthase large subunit-like protein
MSLVKHRFMMTMQELSHSAMQYNRTPVKILILNQSGTWVW